MHCFLFASLLSLIFPFHRFNLTARAYLSGKAWCTGITKPKLLVVSNQGYFSLILHDHRGLSYLVTQKPKLMQASSQYMLPKRRRERRICQTSTWVLRCRLQVTQATPTPTSLTKRSSLDISEFKWAGKCNAFMCLDKVRCLCMVQLTLTFIPLCWVGSYKTYSYYFNDYY